MVLPCFFGAGTPPFKPKFATFNGLNVAQYDGVRWKSGAIGVITSCGGIIKCARGYIALGAGNNVTDRTSLALSADGLTGWSPIAINPYGASGATDSTYALCSAIATDGANTIVIGWQMGYWAGAGTYTSTDGGYTWTWTNLTGLLQVAGGQTTINNITFDGTYFVLGAMCNNHDGSAYGNKAAYSVDGINWTGIPVARGEAYSVNGYTCLASGWPQPGYTLQYASSPTSGSWSTSTAPIASSGTRDYRPFIAYDQGNYVVTCGSAGPYRSDSLFGSWTNAGMPTATSYSVVGKGGVMLMWGVPEAKIWKSTTGGAAWVDALCPIVPGYLTTF